MKFNYKMTPDEFLKKAIELYHLSRDPYYYNPNIFRGRSSSISSSFEDLMALFIALNNPNNCQYFTDQAMKFNNKTYYPDVVILEENNNIKHLIDLKTDLGWNRTGLYSFCKKKDELMKSIKNTETFFKKGKTKEKITAIFAEKIVYHIVILSKENSGNIFLDHMIKANETLNNVKVYLLSEGEHPNSYNSLLEKIKIRYEDFDLFINNIIL
jgi:hypothetical protein